MQFYHLKIEIFLQKYLRIGYIDTDYILENIPDYQEINQQLNTNVQVWKKEIEKGKRMFKTRERY